MKFDTPMIAIVLSIVFFYVKMIYSQWRKARSAAKKTNIEIAKARKQGKAPKIPEKPVGAERFSYKVWNWYIAGAAFVLIVVGFVGGGVGNGPQLINPLFDWWWVVVCVGVVGFSFAFK